MTRYTANIPVKTLVMHKENCSKIPREFLDPCGCGDRGQHGNQRWWCEKHVTIDAVNNFMKGKHWAILMCNICFAEN